MPEEELKESVKEEPPKEETTLGRVQRIVAAKLATGKPTKYSAPSKV